MNGTNVFIVIAAQDAAQDVVSQSKNLPVTFLSIEKAREYIKSQPLPVVGHISVTDYTIYTSPINESIELSGLVDSE